MVAQYPSGSNTFIPDADASNRLRIDFTRDPKKFALNRYAQIIPCKKTLGYYLKMTIEEAARIVNSDAAEYAWPDGADRPTGEDGTESFDFLPFRTERKSYSARLGELATEQADFNLGDSHLNIQAQKAMTNRTVQAARVVTTTGNHDAGHFVDADAIPGASGNWAASTTARTDIKRSIMHGVEKILLDTNGVVQQDQLKLVISPNMAKAIQQTQEIHDYIKGSPFALAQIKGEVPSTNGKLFGLPDHLYGVALEVEQTVRVTSRKGASTARSFAFPSASAALISRVGGLEGVYGAPSFSSLSMFVYSKDDMTVETLKDTNNRRTQYSVVDNFAAVMTAPAASFLFTNCQ